MDLLAQHLIQSHPEQVDWTQLASQCSEKCFKGVQSKKVGKNLVKFISDYDTKIDR